MALYAGLEHGDKPLDRAIQLASVSIGHAARAPQPPANHGFWARVWREGRSLTRAGVETVFPRTRRFSLAEKRGHHVNYYRVTDITPEQEEAIWRSALARVGDWYDVGAIAAALFFCIEGRPAHWLDNPRWGVDCVSGMTIDARSNGLVVCGLRPADVITPPIFETHCVDAWEWAPEEEVLG